MTRNELIARLLKAGIESSSLDDIVHDAASQEASNANNGGLDDQINFLIDECGWTSKDILNALEIK